MTTLALIAAWTAVVFVLPPALMLALETAASFLPERRRDDETPAPPPVAVIVPAHNEGDHIRATLQDLRSQLRSEDRLIVIADNCTDDTAAVARECGAETFERNDPERRGKGYALQFAIDRLRPLDPADAPPGCVAFFDADCRIEDGALRRLAGLAAASRRPAQALYLMLAPHDASAQTAVAAFAWIMINHVRVTGLSNLADVTRFTGLGMAAPWAVVSDLDFASGGITEDLALSVEMTRRGAAPLLAPDVKVVSFFPDRSESGVAQRARWEHGSLGVLLRQGPLLLLRGLVRGDFRRVMFALDALIPPLVLFAALLIAAVALTALTAPFAGPGPVAAAGLALALFALSVGLAWVCYGRKALPPSKLAGLGPFLAQKLKIYGREGRSSSKTWTRTDRAGPEGEP